MTSKSMSSRSTAVRDQLIAALRATADYNTADVIAPLAVLWPDEHHLWASAVPTLGGDLPVLTLGDFDPDRSVGPVPWLRIRAVEHEESGPDSPLVLYLPGVSRRQLADPARLPEALQPLAGVAVRSAVFAQRNGLDWTPMAFLSNDVQGLGLSVASSAETRNALRRSLPRLLECRVADLAGRHLDAAEFDKLVVPDVPRSVLAWLEAPDEQQTIAESNGSWDGFVALVRKEFKVDPVGDGPLIAARKLGDREGKWSDVWTRFAEAPRLYPGVVNALRMARPPDLVVPSYRDSWPQDNEQAEEDAYQGIVRLAGKPVDQVRVSLAALRREHELRLATVWADLGQASAAELVRSLSELAELTETYAAGSTVREMASHYAQSGWVVDRAFMAVLATLEQGHPLSSAVASVAEALYRPWLENATTSFQQAWQRNLPQTSETGVSTNEPPGTCLLFVDGLRFDVAAELEEALQARGLATQLDWGLAGVPTVTSTCKPAVTPVSRLLTAGPELTPMTPAGTAATQEPLKKLMAEAGWLYISEDSTGEPCGLGWTEGGDIDALGHQLGAKLAHRIRDEVRSLALRITELLQSGWKRVVVVTDHGWLLLPGRLPKHHVPEHLMAPRKGRCARLADHAVAPDGVPNLPWRWDPTVQIVLAPGIHAFEAGKAYEHGGLSPQESVVPRLIVSKKESDASSLALAMDISWVNLKLTVRVSGAPEGCSVDLRRKANDPSSSLAGEGKPLRNDKASLLADDDHCGEAAIAVVVDSQGRVLAANPTQIPEV